MASESGLPPSVELAWGLRERASKGPKRGLSLDRIIDAGINVALTDGLAAVSMSRVAKELNASTMALYRYVAAKGELLDLMRDRAWGLPPEVKGDAGWRAGLADWASAMLAAFRRHPWAVQLPISGLPMLPNEVSWMDAALAATRDIGLTPSERASVLLLCSGYVRNVALQEAQLDAAFSAAGSSPDEVMFSFATVLRKLADPQRFPALSEVVESGVFDKADGPDDEFVFGLERILDGVDALVRTRKPAK